MYDCVCHILALEPQWVADALEAAVRAMHERVGRAYRRDLYLKQLKQVAICPPQLAASAVCKLKPHVGAMVREDWPHYTPEQRGRLQSLRKAAEAPAEPVKHPPERRMPMEQPAGKPAGRQPAGRPPATRQPAGRQSATRQPATRQPLPDAGGRGATAAPRIESTEAYHAGKRRAEQRPTPTIVPFTPSTALSQALPRAVQAIPAARCGPRRPHGERAGRRGEREAPRGWVPSSRPRPSTQALFTGLDDKVRGASCEDARREAEARLVEAFRAKKRSMLQQTQEYRALHVELKRLKAAVNGYVERAPKTAVAL